jgi:hypothetical protein
MYLAFRFHHIRPATFYEMGYGERQVLMAFLHYEVEQRNKEIESMKEGR